MGFLEISVHALIKKGGKKGKDKTIDTYKQNQQ